MSICIDVESQGRGAGPVDDGQGRELSELDLERLGRQRPAIFPNLLSEILFCAALLGSMMMSEFLISGFNIILPALSADLNIPKESQTWPASVFTLVTGAFLLPFGRLADMYGGKIVFLAGHLWFFIFTLAAGFSRNYMTMIAIRALQGLGPAAFLPTGIMLLGRAYRPGPRKNLVFSLYGAFAPLGFFFGIFIGGVTTQYLSWKWYFWIGSMVLAVVCLIGLLTIPNEGTPKTAQTAVMDWWGVVTTVPGLVLVVFALTDGAHAPNGWGNPYIIVTFILGVAFLAAAVYVEGWVATQPLLPFDLFSPKYMKSMVISLFFAYGAFGIFLFYASFYMENVMGTSAIQTAVYFIPMCVGGIIIGTVGGFVLHLLPGRLLMIISGTADVICMLLFAIIPENPNFWAYIFPSMVCATISIDITYNVTSIYITTNVPSSRQGVAGALINSILCLGISFFLGLADLAVSENEDKGTRQSYKVAFWFGTACAAVALVLFARIRIKPAKSELTMDERQAQQERAGS